MVVGGFAFSDFCLGSALPCCTRLHSVPLLDSVSILLNPKHFITPVIVLLPDLLVLVMPIAFHAISAVFSVKNTFLPLLTSGTLIQARIRDIEINAKLPN